MEQEGDQYKHIEYKLDVSKIMVEEGINNDFYAFDGWWLVNWLKTTAIVAIFVTTAPLYCYIFTTCYW